jgi:ligand-binding sensor domain-containing protein
MLFSLPSAYTPFLRAITLILLGGLHLYAHTQTPPFRHYTVNEGLANSTVYYAMQDSKGFIWFCTESGVNRFDGHTFETFTIKNGLADNENFRCMEDRKGRIWFASYNGRLSYFNGTSFINENTDRSLAYASTNKQYIMDLIEDEAGNIWFSRFEDESSYKYDGKQISRKSGSIKAPDFTHRLFFNDHNTLNYFKFTPEYLYRENLDKGTATPVKSTVRQSENIPNPCRQSVRPDLLYFITSEGLCHFRNDTVYTDLNYTQLGLNSGQPITCFRLNGEDLWIGTVGKGLFRIPEFGTKGFCGTFSRFLDSLSISSVITDTEGGTWISTLSEGVYYIPLAAHYVTNIPLGSVTALNHSPDSGLLATGTYYGHFGIRSGPSLLPRNEWPMTAPGRIKKLKWLSGTEILIGSDFAPYIFDLATQKKRTLVVLPQVQIGFSDCDEDKYGLWVGSRTGIYLLKKDRQLSEVYKPGTENLEKLVSVAGGGENGCWYTTIRDLYWLDLHTGTPTKICGQEVFQSNLKDLRYINGDLWVATDGNGLFLFRNGVPVKRIHSGNSQLTSDVCQQIEDDHKGHIWVATNRGLNVFEASTQGLLLSCTSDDILPSNDIKDLDLHGKHVYVATPSGISVIDTEKFIYSSEPPRPYIISLSAGDKVYQGSEQPELRYSEGIVRLAYTAITFQSAQSLLYRYRLSEEGKQWQETNLNQLELYNLRPGTYKLSLCAKKYNSGWSEPVAFSFTILPEWYQSLWFKLLAGVLFLLLLYLITYGIIKNNRQKHETKQKIAESELRVIRLHMNPHFIFNTLNSLQLFIFRNKFPEANHYIARLSQLIRWIMSYSDKQDISLKEEISFLSTYIELEQLRFEEAFELSLYTDENIDLENTRIPPLIVQPLVENAIKYGLSGRPEKGRLSLSFLKQDRFILITVEDDGVGRDQVRQEQLQSQKKAESTGIRYTEERLKLLTRGAKVKMPLRVTDLFDSGGKACGTRIELIVPVIL